MPVTEHDIAESPGGHVRNSEHGSLQEQILSPAHPGYHVDSPTTTLHKRVGCEEEKILDAFDLAK